MSLRFLLDEDVSPRVAEGLRRLGVDAISVHEVGRARLRIPDQEQLGYAAAEGRVLVTYNRGDFQRRDADWRELGRDHAGIVWCAERSIPRHAIGQLIRALAALATQHDSLANLCLPLPRPAP